jgi:hypothetical protein
MLHGLVCRSRSTNLARSWSVVGTRAGVVSVPPIGASRIQSLAPQPIAPTIAISVPIVAGPPPESDPDPNEAVVEAVVVSMCEVLVITVPSTVVAMPGILTAAHAAHMPAAAIPTPTGIVATAAHAADMPAAPTSTRVVATATTPSDVASMPTAAAEVATSSTHATEVVTSSTASTPHATATTAAATNQRNITLGRAERTLQVGNARVRLPHNYRDKKQAACKGSQCSYTHCH